MNIRYGMACVVALVTMAVTAPAPADARLVGDFQARVKGFNPVFGSYTVVAGARVFDSTGEAAPALAGASVFFPAGAEVRRRFLRERYFCDPDRLREQPDPKLCPRARFASGRIVLDARPEVLDSLSANIHLFLARAERPGEIASVVVLVVPNEQTPVYAFQVLRGRLVESGGGRFGYRLELPARIEPLLPTVTLTLAEIRLSIRGLREQVRGRTVFWTTAPECPRGRRVSFGARYRFEGGAAPIFKRRSISCARLLRNPSIDGNAPIPR